MYLSEALYIDKIGSWHKTVKKLVRDKHSSLFCQSASDERKSFIRLAKYGLRDATTFSITAFSILTLGIARLDTLTLSITILNMMDISDSHQNNTQNEHRVSPC
jgi:hypothetical protein